MLRKAVYVIPPLMKCQLIELAMPNVSHLWLLFACCICLASPSTAQSQTCTFRTFAGAGVTGSADGAGTNASFNWSCGIAADNAGNLYVADFGDHTIRKITPKGTVTTFAGRAGCWGSEDGSPGQARFNGPRGVAVDSVGNIYVADTGNSTIRKITPEGFVSTLAGLAGSLGTADGISSKARFTGPCGIAADGADDLYVADTENETVRKVTREGVVSTVAGLPRGFGSNDGTTHDARLGGPSGVAVDRMGNLFVLESRQSTIRKITPQGEVRTFAGVALRSGSADGVGTNAQFCAPRAIAVDSGGNLYVADTDNQTIRKVTPEGMVSTVAGLARSSGSTNGTGSFARFRWPEGIAVDTSGNLYVADTLNSTIRKGVFQRLPAPQ